MKPRIFITLSILLGSYLTSAQEIYNMYPNYQPGAENVIQYITNSGYGISRDEISPVIPLEVNGKLRQGTVLSKWPGHNEADIDLYEIKVFKEGVLSIVANPIAYDEKGVLSLQVFVNDNRMEGGIALKRLNAKSYDKRTRNDGWSVTDSYSFYAYPGTYYLKVDGKYGDGQGKYLPLTYQVGVIQDDNVNRYSGDLGKDIGPYNPSTSAGYPIDLGKTLLNNNSINIVSSLSIENWMRRAEGNFHAKKSAYTNTNSRDDFWFTPSTSGKVYFHLNAFSSEAMEVWQRAWKNHYKKELSEYPLFTMSVMHLKVKSYNLVSKQSNFEGSLDVVADGKYKVSISSNNRPAYYRLYISYSEKLPPLETTDINPDGNQFDPSPNQFDPSPNAIQNTNLNGLWGNDNFDIQIDGNEANLVQAIDISSWQSYNFDKGSLILKNIVNTGNNSWECNEIWFFENTSYTLWVMGLITMNSDGNSFNISTLNPCDGSLSNLTLYRKTF